MTYQTVDAPKLLPKNQLSFYIDIIQAITAVVLNLFDLLAYPRPIKKRTGALCMGSQNNMLNAQTI